VEGVSVADVMAAAGLTHGGFYGHYRSKSELAATACRNVLTQSAARWRRRATEATEAGRDPIEAIVSSYLSPEHLLEPAKGCAIPNLAGESARVGGALAAAMTEGIDGLLAVLAELAPMPVPQNEAAARAALAAMVGGILLARTSDDPDRANSLLEAARTAALHALQPAT
jgi:TetR/AcrR family transcriptional repressor of nem operon